MTCGRVRPRGAPLFQDSVVTDLAVAHLRGASSEHRQGPAATRWQAVVGEAPAWSLLPGDTEHSSQAQGPGHRWAESESSQLGRGSGPAMASLSPTLPTSPYHRGAPLMVRTSITFQNIPWGHS